ncbi:MAG: hypothetical protein ACYS76_15800 [Planctomycetota bacterium]
MDVKELVRVKLLTKTLQDAVEELTRQLHEGDTKKVQGKEKGKYSEQENDQ